MLKRLPLLAAAFGLALGTSAGPGAAQDYPSRPITMVVPYAAGGPTDTVARLVAESMGGTLGQQVMVENVGGAGGTLGAGRVAEADPNGYTLLLHHIGLATAPALYRQLRFDPLKDFAPIGLVTEAPMTLVSRPDLPARTAAEILDWIRERKDQVTYANAGLGGGSHICGMLLMSALDTQMTTVPYKGTGPAMTDLMGSQVDLMCDQATNTVGPIKGGQVKAFAVTARDRIPALPDLPTLDEAGLEGFEVTIWHGLYAPAGTPPAVVDRLAAALQAALQDRKVLDRFADIATTPVPAAQATPAALADVLAAEVARWRPIIEAAGVYAD
jgi:tripartite-type tricarboxylate transporter receptor subunit TctC